MERTRRTLDMWASCKRARIAGCDGCPTLDAIFERPAPLCEPWLDRRTGLWMTDAELLVKTASYRPLPEPRLAELEVDRSFAALGSPRLAVSLLLFLYPRSGPYEQPGELSEFPGRALLGELGGRPLKRSFSSLLAQVHREAVARLAGCAAEPSDAPMVASDR